MDKLNDLFTRIITKLNKKVDSVEGKALSSNDYTTAEKDKLKGVADGAQVNTIETISVNETKVAPDEAKNVEIKAYNEDNKPEVGGRNLILQSKLVNGYIDKNNGTLVLDSDSQSSDFIKVSTYNFVTLSLEATPKVYGYLNRLLWAAVAFYDKDKKFLSRQDKQLFGELDGALKKLIITIDIPGETEYIRVSGYTRTSDDAKFKVEFGEIATDWTPAPEDLAPIDEQKILAQIANRTYQGTDLTVKFKSEIDGNFNGNPWAWIQDRINNANWDGLHVCDYIPFTTVGLETNVTMQAQIAGMDTYYQYSEQPIPHHIDFITREIWPTLHTFNPVNYNNGTAEQNYPWLASDMYLWLNSKAGTVPNATTVNPETTDVDYTTDGVYYFLPEELKAVIIEKRFLLETRYNASSLLTTSPGWGWQNEGKLWLPTEMEVYGTNVWGGAGYPTGGGIQYPIFANSMNRLKYRSGSRYYWWLSTPHSGDSTRWCYVVHNGNASDATATITWIGAPVCFRIASTVKSADTPVEGPEMMDEYMQSDEALSPEFEKPIDRSPETEDEPLTE